MPRPAVEPLTLVASVFFMGAGTLHFVRPDVFEAIVPDWFPDAKLANYASGAAEAVLGLGLLPARTRRWSAFGLLALLVVVFPANVDMAVNDVELRQVDGRMTRSVGTASGASRLVNWARLPLQVPLAWAMWRVARRATDADPGAVA